MLATAAPQTTASSRVVGRPRWVGGAWAWVLIVRPHNQTVRPTARRAVGRHIASRRRGTQRGVEEPRRRAPRAGPGLVGSEPPHVGEDDERLPPDDDGEGGHQ